MHRILFALVCAMLSLFTAPAFAGNDTYSCDAYAEYYADARGTISVVRRQWSSITYQIAVVHKDERKEVSTIVFFSGDPLVDARYRNTAPAYTGKMSPNSILTWMSKAPHNQIIEEARGKHVARSANEHIRTLQSHAVCWKNGDPSPDRSAWPSTWTCKGAVYFRLRLGEDLSPVQEIVFERANLAGPETAAWSELRGLLIAAARGRADSKTGNPESFVLDTIGGAADATPIKCWNGMRKGAPVDWRGPTMW